MRLPSYLRSALVDGQDLLIDIKSVCCVIGPACTAWISGAGAEPRFEIWADDACRTTPRHLLPGCPLARKAEDPAPVVNCQVAHVYAGVASNTVASWDVAWSIAEPAGSKP
uniref:Uncharacterized protein n=1 Tax=Photinus pyralis TaxID=7054 RepID=A0A1Y1M8H3_PHOPY